MNADELKTAQGLAKLISAEATTLAAQGASCPTSWAHVRAWSGDLIELLEGSEQRAHEVTALVLASIEQTLADHTERLNTHSRTLGAQCATLDVVNQSLFDAARRLDELEEWRAS